jgi:hypothetical protein
VSAPLIRPAYGEGSLVDLLPSVLARLGVAGELDVLGLPPAQGYCVLLVDGLGWTQLRAHPGAAPFLSSLPGRSLTSPVPSTTAASITSLGTGLPPGRHGLVGYQSRIPGTTSLLNALDWDASIDPATYQPYPDVFARAAREGIAATVVSKRRFATSGLTRAALSGGTYRGADTVGERVAAVDAAFTEAGEQPALVYAYDSDLDSTGHRHGPRSAEWYAQLRATDALAEQLADSLPSDATLLVTGDHGMVHVDAAHQIDVEAEPGLADDVVLVGGEARFRHVYTRDGAADDVAARWAERLADRALVRTRDQARAEGWFGPVDERVVPRIGDVVAAALGRYVLLLPSVWPRESRMRGHHGSLTEDEMLVPCLAAAADGARG